MEKYPLPPLASSLSESMRDIGYSPEAVVADIIDNSITATASKVEIWFDSNTSKPVLEIPASEKAFILIEGQKKHLFSSKEVGILQIVAATPQKVPHRKNRSSYS